jgi:hypothetical protein
MRQRCFLVLSLLTFLSPITPRMSTAWQLTPEGSYIERKLASREQAFWEGWLSTVTLRGIHIVGASVHEEITNRILGCDGDTDICSDPQFDPRFAYFLAGVRWNDDPPFRFRRGQGNFSGCKAGKTVRLVTQPRCWANTFKDGQKRASKGVALDGSNATLLARSHFGDMQFLHAMASRDGEASAETRSKILMWSEFTWRVSLGEYDLSKVVAEVPIPGFSDFFAYNREWRVQDLFALGNPHIRSPQAMSDVAFGSLLHMVQDSFAEGHVERLSPNGRSVCEAVAGKPLMPGRIIEFHSYIRQNTEEHGRSDSRNSFSAHWTRDKPDVVDVGKVLYDFYEKRASWDEVRPYIECIFTMDDRSRPASPGERYVLNL